MGLLAPQKQTFGLLNKSNSLPVDNGMNLNQSFDMAQSTPSNPVEGTQNFPMKILNSFVPGLVAGVKSIFTGSTEPYKQVLSEFKKQQDPHIYDISGNDLGISQRKMAENASNLVMGFAGSGNNFGSKIESIAKSKSANEIAPILESIGVKKEILPKASELFAKIDDPKMVSNILNSTYNIKPAGLLNNTITKTESEVSPLFTEAKKYKTAEEFLNGIQDNRSMLNEVKPKEVPISEIKMSQNPVWDSNNELDRNWVRGYADEIKKGVKFPPIIIDETGKIIDGNHQFEALLHTNIKNVEVIPKSQLTDIWNKANETPVQYPLNEADKLIAQGKIRVVSRNGRDVYQYKKGNNWQNARDEDSAVKAVLPKEKPEVKLPAVVEQKLTELEAQKEILQQKIDSSPVAHQNNRLLFDREGRLVELGDAKTRDRIKFIEDRMAEAGIKDPDQYVQAVEQHINDKARLVEINKELNNTKKAVKYSAEGIPMSTSKIESRINLAKYNEKPLVKDRVSSRLAQELHTPQDGKIDSGAELESLERIAQESYNESITLDPETSQEAIELFDDFNVQNIEEKIPDKEKIFITKITRGANELKDITGFKGQARDFYRNIEDVFGKDKGSQITNQFDEAKSANIDELQKSTLELKNEIVDKYGFKKGSKESEAIQNYGEKKITYQDLVKTFGKDKADNIVTAEKWFRNKYDELLDRVNSVREDIYPYDQSKLIPKRKDYFRHYQELSDSFDGLKGSFETPAGISSELSGISSDTQPKSKFLSFAQQRFGNKTKVDAIGGYLNYLPSASYAIHIDPMIGYFRSLASALAGRTAKTRNLNNFIEYLHDFANDLAGKTNIADRFIQKVIPGGRRTMRVIDWMNKRVKTNTVVSNVSSSIAQIFNVPQGIGSAKQYSIPGAVKTFAGNFIDNPEMARSSFIKERYSSSYLNQFDTGILQNTKKFAVWMTGVLDELGTKFIWNSHYSKAVAEKIADPIKYADNITRKLVAGRGVGEVPLVQKSKLFQLVAPFQLEVGNTWWVMKDFISARDFAGLIGMFLTGYLMNRVIEDVRGNDVGFDPINATVQGVKLFNQENDKGIGALKFIGREAGEVLSNIPLGQTLASLYPEYGIKGITRKELFGEGDPTRYGSGILLSKGLQDPLFKIVPPFAGSQIKKTYEGVKAINDGKSVDKAGRTQFEVGGTLPKDLQAVLFGKYANQSAKEYFAGNSTTQAEIEYKKISKSPTAKADFDKIIKENPALAKQILEVKRKIDLGITPADEKLLNLGVANGARAKAIVENLNDLKTKEEKAKLWDEYSKKRILTKDVIPQVLKLLQEKPISMMDKVKDTFSTKVAYADTGKSYWIRDNQITESDLEEAKAVLFSEISNRSKDKQMLEAQTILNTAFNRMEKYNKEKRGGRNNWTLTEVLQEQSQYQGYAPEGFKENGKTIESQYQKYKSGKINPLENRKLEAIDTIINQVKNGTFINNIKDYRFYVHKPDGRIWATREYVGS